MSLQPEELPQLVAVDALASFKPTEPVFLIEQILPADVATLLSAHGGTGKTRLAIQAAICVAMGIPFLGKLTTQATVIFYSAEDDADQLLRMISEVRVSLGVDPIALAQRLIVFDASHADSILYIERFQDGVRKGVTTAAFENLRSWMEHFQARVLIIDNASDVYGGNENDRPQVRGFIRELVKLVRKVNGAVLLLSHIDKQSAKFKNSEAYSGSTAWHNSVRSRLTLVTSEDGVVLDQQKSNRGIKATPIPLVWEGGTLVQANQKSMTHATNNMADSLNLAQVLALIEECYQRREFISTAPTAHSNAFKMLKSELSFPRAIKKPDQLWPLLRMAERNGQLTRESYRTSQRKDQERWRVIPGAAPSAPSSQEGATTPDGAAEAPSAPSCVGGMGGGAHSAGG